MSTSILPANTHVQSSLAFLKELVGWMTPRDFAIRCWDGTTWDPEPGQPARFTLVLNHPGSVRNMFWPPRPLTVSEAYLDDEFNVEGDMVAFVRFCDRLEDRSNTHTLLQKLKLGWRLWRLPKAERVRSGRKSAKLDGALHSPERDRQAISFHYDLSNDFYETFLDSHMVYTCGAFDDENEGLEAAQERRFDVICQKLRLKAGERLLDVGCGWGGLAMHAARNYGAQAYGVTLSKQQAEWAQRKIREAGLEGRCRVELKDYRDVDEGQLFDKISTIEVTEHFGSAQFPTYFQKCWRLLRPQGSLLVQQITLTDPSHMRKGVQDFSQAYVFPDGELVSANFTQKEAEKAGFEVRDLESCREHYALTLHHWLRNLDNRHDDAVRLTNEATYRTFRLYIAGAESLYLYDSHFNLHQMLFVKSHPYASGYPLERRDWYTGKE